MDLSLNAVAGSAPLTLMSTDVERITSGIIYLHDAWANLIQISVAMYLLKRQLGAGCVAPIIVAVGSQQTSEREPMLVFEFQSVWKSPLVSVLRLGVLSVFGSTRS